MNNYCLEPVAISMRLVCYEESETDDTAYEFNRTFYVSLKPEEMLGDIDRIVDVLGLSEQNRFDLLRMITAYQNSESKEQRELCGSNDHWYVIEMDSVYSLFTRENETISLFEALTGANSL